MESFVLGWMIACICPKISNAKFKLFVSVLVGSIVNDANDYANETMNNPAYPLHLFQRVITVSLETMENVRNLPKLEID